MTAELVRLSSAEAVVYDMLRKAARHGSLCPTNETIAQRLRCGTAQASKLVSSLERCGLIDVVRYTRGRVVSVKQDGTKTAPCGGTMHWSSRGVVRVMPVRQEQQFNDDSRAGLAGPFTVLDRDACFFCGVRGDVGCDHRPASQPVEMQ